MSLHDLLQEYGDRWMEPEEQVDLPRGYPRTSRPVWLYLSLVAEDRHLIHRNGMGIPHHMHALRLAFSRP